MKKFIHAGMAFSLVAGLAFAVKPGRPTSKEVVESPEIPYTSTGAYQAASANFTQIQSTGFEAPEWDAGFSVCGDEFAFGVVCFYPTPNPVTGQPCLFKNHAANNNCCPDDAHDATKGDPNEETGWSMSPSSRHCNQPSIDTIHPFAGTQHLRFTYDPLGGNPAGGSGFASSRRTRAIVAQVTQADISKAVWSQEISWDHTLASSMLVLYGQDSSVGSIFRTGGYIYWSWLGYFIIRDNSDGGAGDYFLGGYWSQHLGQYVNFTVEFDPCNDTTKYYYGTSCSLLTSKYCDATTPCLVDEGTCERNEVVSIQHGFNPPYGDIEDDFVAPITDSAFYTQDHYDGSATDIDNHFVTYTPCTDACCDGTTGICTDGVDAVDCAGPSQHYYPNVLCSKLGTADKYPPACNLDTGACCDRSPSSAGPGPEGACTDGVLPADCAGAQQTWTKRSSCAPVVGECNIGIGDCDATGFCDYGHGKIGAACVVNSDCDVAGFCFTGQCTTNGPVGECSYPGGYCEDMGRCSLDPLVQDPAGAKCDLSCATQVPCVDPTLTCVGRVACVDVPNGGDCDYCEGCPNTFGDVFPVVTCFTNADCPAPQVGFPAGFCVPYPSGCYSDADCSVGNTCAIPVQNRSGELCTTNADCDVPGITCLEDRGSCCNTLEGTCADDMLLGECSGAQRIWTKNGECSATPCDAVLGSCCDSDPFGSCTDTTQAGCTCDKCEWLKLQSCSTIECTHNSIPTVSEWGLVVLTLLLLTGAKVYFGRREAVA